MMIDSISSSNFQEDRESKRAREPASERVRTFEGGRGGGAERLRNLQDIPSNM